MSTWTSKDAAINFRNAAAIENLYIRRFEALYLNMVARATKFKNVNAAQPNDADMKNAIDGTNGFIHYDDLTSEDAAVYSCLRGSADKQGKINYQNLDGSIKDKEINKKFIDNIKKSNDDGYEYALNKLSKIQDEAESKAKKEIMGGNEIKFEDDDLKVVESTLGKEYADSVKSVKTKYKTWKEVEGSGVMQAMGGTDYETKFWGDNQQYKNWTEMAAKAKDSIYDGVMHSQTNIVTAPLKIFFFALHEMLNPNSFFRRNVIGKVKANFTKYKENKDAQKKLQELGFTDGDIDDPEIEGNEEEAKTDAQQETPQETPKQETPQQEQPQPQEEPKKEEEPKQEQPKEEPKKEEPKEEQKKEDELEHKKVEISDVEKEKWASMSNEIRSKIVNLAKKSLNLPDSAVDGENALPSVKMAWDRLKDDKSIIGKKFRDTNVGKVFAEEAIPNFREFLKKRLDEKEQ